MFIYCSFRNIYTYISEYYFQNHCMLIVKYILVIFHSIFAISISKLKGTWPNKPKPSPIATGSFGGLSPQNISEVFQDFFQRISAEFSPIENFLGVKLHALPLYQYPTMTCCWWYMDRFPLKCQRKVWKQDESAMNGEENFGSHVYSVQCSVFDKVLWKPIAFSH